MAGKGIFCSFYLFRMLLHYLFVCFFIYICLFQLLKKNNAFLRQRHLQFLLIEIYKSIASLNPWFMWPYFMYRQVSYTLRRRQVLFISSAMPAIKSVHFRGCLIWNKLLTLVKFSRAVSELKNRKHVKSVEHNLGFLISTYL